MAEQEQQSSGPHTWDRRRYERYIASGGVRGTTIDGKQVVILTTINPKTRRERRSPLMQVKQGAEYAVIGSHGGSTEDPAWVADIQAHPTVRLQDGVLQSVYEAHVATGAEREIWWQRAVDVWPAYAQEAERASRIIPVVVLTPAT